MAKKKQEVALMREVESQEEWEDVMAKEGLWVVDVYQDWSGPCDAMVSNFRRIKNELGDDLLNFAKAKCDGIESLEKYRGSCEPCFLFFATGVLVAFVHGANAPLILRTLTEQLTQEHKVIDGTSERKEVKDPFIGSKETAEPTQDEEDEGAEGYVPHRKVSTYPQDYEEVEQGYTVAIIKPNVVKDGKVDEILAEMKARGIDVVAQEERQLTEDEAKEFYSHLKDEEYFNDLVAFMASGPSHVLVLTKGCEDDSIIKDWRDMLGPPTVEDAKEQEPECLRARYGEAGLMNALHGSDSRETAARELAFFFPHMNAPTMQKKKKEVQRTLALIRPDAFVSNRDAILQRIKESGFQIALQKEVELSREQAAEFYREHEGQKYFDELVTRMSSGPLLALGLAREDAVSNWRGMLGPTDVEEAKTTAPDSLRAQFAVPEAQINQLHGSDTVENAKKELNFFFPMEQTVAMIKPDGIGTKEAIIDKIHQAGFRIAARKETNITREIAESFYEDQKDKEYYNDLVEHMISGPTMFMVLSREGAVQGWREEIGPTNPDTAKEIAPNSLRAQFGTDILKNAVHGASNQEEAQKKIKAVFGDLEFNPDGTVKGEVPQNEEEEQVEQQKAEDAQAEEQAEQQAEAEGQAEGVEQSEEKPAEGEAAEKKEGEVGEEKPSEQAAESADKDDSAEKADDKPSEQAAESADKDKDEKDKDDKDKDDKDKDDKDKDDKDKDDKDKDDKDDKGKEEKDKEDKEKEEKDKDDKEKDSGEAAQMNATNNAQVDESNNAQTDEQKEQTTTEEQKEEAKADEQKEETKAEEQKEEQKEEEGKAEKKEDAAEAKKEGEEGKAAE